MTKIAQRIAAARIGLAVTAAILVADGGTVLFRKPAGPYIVTAFSEPVPVRVGSADFSAMVQNGKDASTVLDAIVAVRLKQSTGGKIVEVVAPATHARATNKLLYAAHVTLPSAGQWLLTVDVTAKDNGGGSASGEVASGEIDVLPQQAPVPAYWPYFAVVPVLVLFFAMNQWLKRKRRLRNPQARP